MSLSDDDWIYVLKNMKLQERVLCQFRWCRMWDTQVNSVYLLLDQFKNSVCLTWDSRRRVYESLPVWVGCGRYECFLQMGAFRMLLEPFYVTSFTFQVELHLYLGREEETVSPEGVTNQVPTVETTTAASEDPGKNPGDVPAEEGPYKATVKQSSEKQQQNIVNENGQNVEQVQKSEQKLIQDQRGPGQDPGSEQEKDQAQDQLTESEQDPGQCKGSGSERGPTQEEGSELRQDPDQSQGSKENPAGGEGAVTEEDPDKCEGSEQEEGTDKDQSAYTDQEQIHNLKEGSVQEQCPITEQEQKTEHQKEQETEQDQSSDDKDCDHQTEIKDQGKDQVNDLLVAVENYVTVTEAAEAALNQEKVTDSSCDQNSEQTDTKQQKVDSDIQVIANPKSDEVSPGEADVAETIDTCDGQTAGGQVVDITKEIVADVTENPSSELQKAQNSTELDISEAPSTAHSQQLGKDDIGEPCVDEVITPAHVTSVQQVGPRQTIVIDDNNNTHINSVPSASAAEEIQTEDVEDEEIDEAKSTEETANPNQIDVAGSVEDITNPAQVDLKSVSNTEHKGVVTLHTLESEDSVLQVPVCVVEKEVALSEVLHVSDLIGCEVSEQTAPPDQLKPGEDKVLGDSEGKVAESSEMEGESGDCASLSNSINRYEKLLRKQLIGKTSESEMESEKNGRLHSSKKVRKSEEKYDDKYGSNRKTSNGYDSAGLDTQRHSTEREIAHHSTGTNGTGEHRKTEMISNEMDSARRLDNRETDSSYRSGYYHRDSERSPERRSDRNPGHRSERDQKHRSDQNLEHKSDRSPERRSVKILDERSDSDHLRRSDLSPERKYDRNTELRSEHRSDRSHDRRSEMRSDDQVDRRPERASDRSPERRYDRSLESRSDRSPVRKLNQSSESRIEKSDPRVSLRSRESYDVEYTSNRSGDPARSQRDYDGVSAAMPQLSTRSTVETAPVSMRQSSVLPSSYREDSNINSDSESTIKALKQIVRDRDNQIDQYRTKTRQLEDELNRSSSQTRSNNSELERRVNELIREKENLRTEVCQLQEALDTARRAQPATEGGRAEDSSDTAIGNYKPNNPLALQRKIEELKSQIQDLQEANETAVSNLSQAEQELSDLKEENENLKHANEINLGDLQRENTRLREQLKRSSGEDVDAMICEEESYLRKELGQLRDDLRTLREKNYKLNEDNIRLRERLMDISVSDRSSERSRSGERGYTAKSGVDERDNYRREEKSDWIKDSPSRTRDLEISRSTHRSTFRGDLLTRDRDYTSSLDRRSDGYQGSDYGTAHLSPTHSHSSIHSTGRRSYGSAHSSPIHSTSPRSRIDVGNLPRYSTYRGSTDRYRAKSSDPYLPSATYSRDRDHKDQEDCHKDSYYTNSLSKREHDARYQADLDRGRMERERAEREKVEHERMERERAEWERMERERAERERAERQRTYSAHSQPSNRDYMDSKTNPLANDFPLSPPNEASLERRRDYRGHMKSQSSSTVEQTRYQARSGTREPLPVSQEVAIPAHSRNGHVSSQILMGLSEDDLADLPNRLKLRERSDSTNSNNTDFILNEANKAGICDLPETPRSVAAREAEIDEELRQMEAPVSAPEPLPPSGLRTVIPEPTVTQHNKHIMGSQKTDASFSTSGMRPFAPRAPADITINNVVKFCRDGGVISRGMVKYIGHLPGKNVLFLGVELEKEDGKHDGTYEGQRYFNCKPGRGLFVPFEKVVMAWGNY